MRTNEGAATYALTKVYRLPPFPIFCRKFFLVKKPNQETSIANSFCWLGSLHPPPIHQFHEVVGLRLRSFLLANPQASESVS